jgi:glycosyltransferase involved in cell wall biosynthesis
MRIALVADTFPPLRTSGAVQLMDLSQEFVLQGHKLTVMLPTAGMSSPWLVEDIEGVQVLRLRAPKTKDINHVRRTINEFLMPFSMLHNLRKSPLAEERWDGVIWYSPSIFNGPLANALKNVSGCKGYLIVRDIFPEWAADMGLMRRGLPYNFFKAVANYQYSVADVIGIQTQGNLPYFDGRTNSRIEVLQNWLSYVPNVGCSIYLASSKLAGRIVFVYSGNLGLAQGMGVLLDLAERLLRRTDIGFLFVGRGSEAKRLRLDAHRRGLHNTLFHDEIEVTEIPGLYAQCHIGIVALDTRHKTHNIPGKFVSYMQAGLPVLASINPGNDLEEIILREGVGRVCTDQAVENLQRLALELVEEVATGSVAGVNSTVTERCKTLSVKLFSTETAVKQILAALKK